MNSDIYAMSDLRLISFKSDRYTGKRAVAIGSFDGIHLGHRFMLDQLRKESEKRGLIATALTFDPHPRSLLSPKSKIRLLTTLDEKVQELSNCAIDACAILYFTPQIASLTAKEFMHNVLRDELNTQLLLIGYNHHFGKPQQQEGFKEYREYGRNLGIEVILIPHFSKNQQISSSSIRQLLLNGKVEEAMLSLGHPYEVTGKVIHGFRNGRKIGFPTANIYPSPEKLIPQQGSYATMIDIEGKKYPSMTNIGIRPTLNNGTTVTIETHILDFNADLYGKILTLQFINRLRDEKCFPNVETLKSQLFEDAYRVKQLLTHE